MNQFIECELKEVAEDGTFKGIASVYGIEDLGGDIIDKGAFTKTLSENKTVPILWQHDAHEVIGSGEVKEWQGKVLLSGTLDMTDPLAIKAHAKMKARLIKGLSIGFSTVKSTWEKQSDRMVRRISELKLWEVSVVTFPMLPQAQVTSVKDADALENRLSRIEADNASLRTELMALKAAQTTLAEPVKATEPPTPKATEPVEDHSALMVMIASARLAIPN